MAIGLLGRTVDVVNDYPAFVRVEGDGSKCQDQNLPRCGDHASVLPAVTLCVSMERSPGARKRGENLKCCGCIESFERLSAIPTTGQSLIQPGWEHLGVDDRAAFAFDGEGSPVESGH